MSFTPKNKLVVSVVSLLLVLGAALFWIAAVGAPGGATAPVSDAYYDVKDFLNGLITVKKGALPASYKLKVPFTAQSPFANWVLPYEEACEETSVLIVDYFMRSKTFTPAIANAEILKIVDWEKKVFGDYIHTDVNATARLAKEYFGYKNVRIIENPTVDQIKREIVAGHPVIVPSAGRELGNKYFKTPGPIYHMYVITGYSGSDFITNDPGTKRGENYRYSSTVVMRSMHDWAGTDETIDQGRKAIIIIDPPAKK